MRVAVSSPMRLPMKWRDVPGDAAPMGEGLGVVGVLLALAGLPIGPGAVVADQGLGVGLRQAFGLLASSEP